MLGAHVYYRCTCKLFEVPCESLVLKSEPKEQIERPEKSLAEIPYGCMIIEEFLSVQPDNLQPKNSFAQRLPSKSLKERRISPKQN